MTKKKIFETFREILMYTVFLLCALISVIAVLLICVFLFYKGLPTIFRDIGFFEFIFNNRWFPTSDNPSFGIFNMIIGSLYVTAFALILGVPIAFFCAVFLSTSCPSKIVKIIKPIIELLAGIPSIIFGFVGMVLIVPVLKNSVISAAIVLAVMILPTIITLSISAIESVPRSYYEGAVALGASHTEAVYRTVIPAARRGIISSIILALGRALGETTAVILVAGNAAIVPESIYDSVRTLTANIVLEMGYAQDLHADALIATGVVLFIFILILNLVITVIRSEFKFRPLKLFRRKTISSAIITSGLSLGLNSLNTPNKMTSSKTYNLPITSYKAASKKQPVEQILIKHNNPSKTNIMLRKLLFNLYKPSMIFSVVLAIFCCVSIVVYVFARGLGHINFDFLFGVYTPKAPTVMPFILSTFYTVIIGLLIAAPIGIFSAVFLCEYRSQKSKVLNFIVGIIRIATDTLTGIPSIIFGLFGMLIFVKLFGFGYSLISGILTVTLIILPTIIRSSEEAIKAVPVSLREASYALGASRLGTTFKVVLPSAASGIVAGIILSAGRIIGESAAFLFTTGIGYQVPTSLKDSTRTLSVALYWFANEGLHLDKAYATAAVLIIFVLIINIITNRISQPLKKKTKYL